MDGEAVERLVPLSKVTKFLLLITHRSFVKVSVENMFLVAEQIQAFTSESDLRLTEFHTISGQGGFRHSNLAKVLYDILRGRRSVGGKVLDELVGISDFEKQEVLVILVAC